MCLGGGANEAAAWCLVPGDSDGGRQQALTVSQAGQGLRDVVLTRLDALSLRLARASGHPVVDAAWNLVVDLEAPSASSSTAAAATAVVFGAAWMPPSFCYVA